MVKKGYTPEQIINKLREAELQLQQGNTIAIASKTIGVSSHTYYRWRKEYGGLRIEQAKKLKTLEKENARLKKLVADLSLDNAILKEARVLVEQWMWEYNHIRPHSSLGYQPPAPETKTPVELTL